MQFLIFYKSYSQHSPNFAFHHPNRRTLSRGGRTLPPRREERGVIWARQQDCGGAFVRVLLQYSGKIKKGAPSFIIYLSFIPSAIIHYTLCFFFLNTQQVSQTMAENEVVCLSGKCGNTKRGSARYVIERQSEVCTSLFLFF